LSVLLAGSNGDIPWTAPAPNGSAAIWLKAAARAGDAMIATLQARIDELEKDLRAADNLQVWANGSRSGITRR
jgi:hypothetical protein